MNTTLDHSFHIIIRNFYSYLLLYTLELLYTSPLLYTGDNFHLQILWATKSVYKS